MENYVASNELKWERSMARIKLLMQRCGSQQEGLQTTYFTFIDYEFQKKRTSGQIRYIDRRRIKIS